MGAETTVSRLIFFRSIGYSGVGRTQAKRKPQAGNAAILGAIVGLPLWLSWEVLMNLMVSNSSEGLHHKTIQSSRYQKKFSHVNISGIMTGALPNQFWPNSLSTFVLVVVFLERQHYFFRCVLLGHHGTYAFWDSWGQEVLQLPSSNLTVGYGNHMK